MRIHTDGYRGMKFGNRWIPPGDYTVGADLDLEAGIIDVAQANHMIAVGLAHVIPPVVVDQSDPADTPESWEDGEELDDTPPSAFIDAPPEVEIEGDSIYEQYTVREMREIAKERGIDLSGLQLRNDIIRALDDADRAEVDQD